MWDMGEERQYSTDIENMCITPSVLYIISWDFIEEIEIYLHPRKDSSYISLLHTFV